MRREDIHANERGTFAALADTAFNPRQEVILTLNQEPVNLRGRQTPLLFTDSLLVLPESSGGNPRRVDIRHAQGLRPAWLIQVYETVPLGLVLEHLGKLKSLFFKTPVFFLG